MRNTGLIGRLAAAGGAVSVALVLASASQAQNIDAIPIGVGAQAESIAATPDGGLIIGTTGGTIYRVAPGATEATEWITGLEGFTLGVFAVGTTAYVCNGANLRTYDLDTAEPGPVHEFPGGGFCNDIAVSPDGTIFVTDTGNGRVLALVDGEDGPELITVMQSTGISGADGLAFVGDTLYVNDVRQDLLVRLDLDGTRLTGFQVLETSQPMDGPDGLRVAEDGNGMYQANNGTREIVHITVDGDTATVTTVATGFPAATAVAQVGNTLYVVGAIFGGGADATAMYYVHTVDLGM